MRSEIFKVIQIEGVSDFKTVDGEIIQLNNRLVYKLESPDGLVLKVDDFSPGSFLNLKENKNYKIKIAEIE